MRLFISNITIHIVIILITIIQVYGDAPKFFTQSIPFDADTKTASSNVNITCSNNSLIEVVSVAYNKGTTRCSTLSCPIYTADHGGQYLSGTNKVCRNEEKIRTSCYGRRSCSLAAAGVVTPTGCEVGFPSPDTVLVKYACVSSDLVFDLCESRSGVVGSNVPFILAVTPKDSGPAVKSCSCELMPTSGGNFPGLTLVRQRMAQFTDGNRLHYTGSRGHFDKYDSESYTSYYLLLKKTFEPNVSSLTVLFSAGGTPIIRSSTAFIKITSSGRTTVQCNDDIGIPIPGGKSTATTTATTTTTTTTAAREITPIKTKKIIAPVATLTQSSTTSGSETPSVTEENSTGSVEEIDDSDDMMKMKRTIIGLVVSLIVVIGVAMVITILLCIRRRNKRRNKYMEKLKLANNNSESTLLYSESRHQAEEEVAEEVGTEYHELEEVDVDYAVIPGENIYTDPYAQAEQPLDTDPYKVTYLDGGTLPSHYYDRQKSTSSYGDQVRNSRGSIDTYTENSTVTEDHYSQPCDVQGGTSTQPNQVDYDIPAEVTYSAIQKPSVELLDNPLYEAS